jgi:hypothetical protein
VEPPYFLRARNLDIQNLLVFVARTKGRSVVVGPEVESTLSLDLERDSILEIEGEVVRASGASSLVTGNTVLVGGAARVASAKRHPLQVLLAGGGEHKGRRVTLYFTRYRLTNLLRLLADVSKRQFEVAEGLEDWVSIAANEVRWTEILDVLAVTSDLVRQEVNGTIRVSRRGDNSPRFSPLGRDLVDEPYDPRTPHEVGEGRCAPPLGDSEPSQVKLVAVMAGPTGPEALMRLPNYGKPYVVRRNSCIGPAGGLVSSIERDRVVVFERRLRADGTGAAAERVLELDGEQRF